MFYYILEVALLATVTSCIRADSFIPPFEV